MIPMTRGVDLFLPYGACRAVFVPAPAQTAVLVVTVATHPDDKPEIRHAGAGDPERLPQRAPMENRSRTVAALT